MLRARKHVLPRQCTVDAPRSLVMGSAHAAITSAGKKKEEAARRRAELETRDACPREVDANGISINSLRETSFLFSCPFAG